MKITGYIFLISFFNVVGLVGGEKNPSATHAMSIAEMKIMIKEQTNKGKMHVSFKSGHFYLHSLTYDKKEKAPQANLRIKADSYSSKNLHQWLKENDISSVLISLDDDLPADYFFRIEQLLRKNHIKYSLIVRSAPKGEIHFDEFMGYKAINGKHPILPQLDPDK